MPTYGYQCAKCAHTFEVLQKITDEPLRECPECKGKVRRLLYPVGIVFKGSGFHVNDYRKPEKKAGDGHEKPKTDAGKTAKPAEAAETPK